MAKETASDFALGEEHVLVYARLGKRERRVVRIFAARLLEGQTQYGKLRKGKKKWAKEAFEESVDKEVYLICGLMDLQDEGY